MSQDQAIARGVGIFAALASEANGLSLAELCRRLDVSKSGLHRSLNTLVDLGYVKQDPGTENYSLTMRLTTLALRHLAATRIPDVCQPILDKLAATTGELVRMAIVEGETISWVAKAQGSKAGLRFDPDMERELLLHATANGKAWLANISDDDAIRLVLQQGFGNFKTLGPRACRTTEAFVKALKDTRRRGYAIAIDEFEAGTSVVAAAIHSPIPKNRVVGTVSIAGPTARLNEKRLAEFAVLVLEVANELGAIWPIIRLDRRSAAAINRVDINKTDRRNAGGSKWKGKVVENL
jgi:IclR family acetate operon transcriptional repressor